MAAIKDCSQLSGIDLTRCEGDNVRLKLKQKEDTDCNKRIEAAKRNSLTTLAQTYDCKEKLPSQTLEKWTSIEEWKASAEEWKEWGQNWTNIESWKEFGQSWVNLENWKDGSNPQKLLITVGPYIAYKVVATVASDLLLLRHLRAAAMNHPNAHLANALAGTGVAGG